MTGSRKLIGLVAAVAGIVALAFSALAQAERGDMCEQIVLCYGLFCGANAAVHWAQKEPPK